MSVYEKISINLPPRVQIARIICFGIFFVILLRLWYLQILRGDYFREQSENNRIRTVYVPPQRGLIVDRNGKVLVKNRPSFDIDFISEDSPDPITTIQTLAQITAQDPDLLLSRLGEQRKRRRFEPKLLLRDVSRDVVAKISARHYELPGVLVTVNPARQYVYGDLAAHVLGYLREISKSQLESPGYSSYYRSGDFVGQFGIESKWERYLQGSRGMQQVIVNAAGTRIGELHFEPEHPGNTVALTLDFDAQRAADEGLKDARGAIVAMDPRTGKILAMASSPRFDPNLFTGELDSAAWADLVTGREKKMSNRAAQGGYPPGSVFKIFMAVAALAEGVVTPQYQVFCPGYFTFGSRTFRCHKKSGHGWVNLHSALVQSCDVYFYTVGNLLGIDRIHDYATRFGLGKATGLELVQEHPGVIPSTEWKRRYFKRLEDQKWYPGETLSVSIGQGAVVTTPLQIARALSAVVNSGKVMKPYLVREIRSADGQMRDQDFEPEVDATVDVDPWILKAVRSGLAGVVNEPTGTGHAAQLEPGFEIKVGGKTGTAQVVSLGAGQGDNHNDHAWFAGFAPLENPEIVVVALIENGGHGGAAAAPRVRKVMEAYFNSERISRGEPPILGKTAGTVAISPSARPTPNVSPTPIAPAAQVEAPNAD